MPKQTLYEFLGVPPEAADDHIAGRCQLHRKVINSYTDAADRNNQLVFLQHAEDTLLNSEKRVRYDRQLRKEAESAQTSVTFEEAHPRHWGKPMLSSLLIVSIGAFAWEKFGHHSATTPPLVQQASQQAETEVNVEVPKEMAEAPPTDSAAADTQNGTPSPARQAAPLANPVPKSKTVVSYTIQTRSPYAQLLGKLVWSVFAIQGTNTFGTGVLIDDEKLLTNCHTIAHNAGYNHKIYAINSVTRQRVELTSVAYRTFAGDDACLVIAPGLKGKPVALGDIYGLTSGAKLHNIGFAQGSLISSDGNFTGITNINGQGFVQSTNYCEHGVSGGPLVDDNGSLIGLTTGGTADHSKCFSLSIETARRVLEEPTISIEEFPTNYTSNVVKR